MASGDPAIDIVKRGGKRTTERFERNKLHASVLAACLSVQSPQGVAHSAADSVCEAVLRWCHTRPEITSDDVRRIAAGQLDVLHPEAAYLYKHHRLVL
jgi:transcriptional regulator NrdR family protein